MHDDHHHLLRQSWEQEEDLLAIMSGFSSLQQYIDSLGDDIDRAFHPEHCCFCIDERIRRGGFRIAGSGILHPGGVGAVAALMVRAGMTEVSWHDGCGAARIGLAINRYNLPPSKLTEEQLESFRAEAVQAFGREWAEQLATEMQRLSKRTVKVQHVTSKDIAGPEHLHVARAVYFDGTGKFHSGFDRLPQGFVISARHYDTLENAVADVDLAKKIAFGSHGFGELFTAEQPLHIICICDPLEAAFSAPSLPKAIDQWLSSLVPGERERLQLDTFTASIR